MIAEFLSESEGGLAPPRLRPAEPRRGSGVLVYDVTNRGRKVILGRLDEAGADADTNNPRSVQDVGLAFTLRRGYSLIWSG